VAWDDVVTTLGAVSSVGAAMTGTTGVATTAAGVEPGVITGLLGGELFVGPLVALLVKGPLAGGFLKLVSRCTTLASRAGPIKTMHAPSITTSPTSI